MKAQRKILALHESVRPALLDELINGSTASASPRNPSAKDIRYTLDILYMRTGLASMVSIPADVR